MAPQLIGWGAALEENESDQLVVFISGYGRGEQATFHFADFAQQLNQSKLFLRDFHNAYYQYGIRGVTETDDENIEFLEYLVKKLGVKRVTLVSGSVGARPTLMWGHKLGVTDIHLIGPVTDIDTMLETDRSKHDAFAEIAKHSAKLQAEKDPHLNLRKFVKDNAKQVECIDVYYGKDDETDAQQAENITDLDHVRTTLYYQGNHFRVPIFVQRRDPDLADRINAKTVDNIASLRKSKTFSDTDLGYAKVFLA